MGRWFGVSAKIGEDYVELEQHKAIVAGTFAPMSRGVFKVLSIDGGGIKGVYTATMLRVLEHAVAKTPGHPRLGEYFDLICGTSTGALNALGLAAGRTCDEIADTYLTKGPKIF